MQRRAPHAAIDSSVPHYDQLMAAVDKVRAAWNCRPRVALVLGTGLGEVAREIQVESVLPYEQIPFLPPSTAIGHAGRLVCGRLAGMPVVAMEGRLHAYEGYPLWQTTLPIRLFREIGAEVLTLCSAVGGLNPAMNAGDLMLVDDHLCLMGDNPLIGVRDPRLGPLRLEMCDAYDRQLAAEAAQAALQEQVPLHRGVLAALRGPNLETRSEYRLLRRIGADAVGMSMPPEAIVARHCGLKVLGLAAVTNVCLPDRLGPVGIGEIVDNAHVAQPNLRRILMRLFERWAKHNPRHRTTSSVASLA